MLRGDREAVTRLRAAGAAAPEMRPAARVAAEMQSLAGLISRAVPTIYVTDVGRSIDWYVSIGFTELERFEGGGIVNFGMVAFGGAQLMLNMHGGTGKHDVSLWFHTDAVDRLYAAFKVARALDGAGGARRRVQAGGADRLHPGHRGHVLRRAAVLHPRPRWL